MNQKFRENDLDAEWRARFSILQNAPAPNLERGRARVLALAQKNRAANIPARVSFAFALGVGIAVILMMVVMSSVMGALPTTSVAMTRTEISPNVAPANVLTRSPFELNSKNARQTPVPNAVPEPPRSPAVLSTQTLSP